MRASARIGAHSPKGYGALEEAILGDSRTASRRICFFTSPAFSELLHGEREDLQVAAAAFPNRAKETP